MGRQNPSGSGATLSAKVDGSLIEAFDQWCESGDISSRSEGVRVLLRDAVDGHAPQGLPRQPPVDDQLDYAYRQLVDAANGDGIVPVRGAKRVCSGGPRNMSKQEVFDMALKPLMRRGYLRRRSDLYGHTAFEVLGL